MTDKSNPMRVLHLIDTDGLGGAQSLLTGFVDHPASSTQHKIFALRKHPNQLLAPSASVETYASSSKYSLKPLELIRSRIRRGDFDIIHCHLPRSLATGWLANATTSAPVVLVAHEHGQILGSNDRTLLSDFAYCTLKRLTKRGFSHHIAVSNATRDALTARVSVPKEEITVVPSYVDTSKYNPTARRERRPECRGSLGLTEDQFVVGLAGRMTAKKGWRVFMDALRKFSGSTKVPTAVVTGDGPERSDFEQVVAALPADIEVRDLRWVEDIRDFYAMLDCFVAPSFAEGSPVAAREAMAVGLPIVTSNADGFLDLVDDGENGLIFPVGDSEALWQQLSSIQSDPQKAEYLAEKAALRAEEFAVEKYLDALDDVYTTCLNAAARR